jgi:valine--pyruvate aminotransferase
MEWTWSELGNRFEHPSGILELMDDLGEAMSRGGADLCMLGGGNPAPIPEVQSLFRQAWVDLGAEDRLDDVLGAYDTAQGAPHFLEAVAGYLNDHYQWGLTPENIGICNGSQTAFYQLFNLLADGTKNIMLPLSPEYIGYADQGLHPGLFHSVHGMLKETGSHRFKYHVDFDALPISERVAALAVSRPTNPTGNVLTDDEIQHLSDLALRHEIPLLIDNAYGAPFPGIVFKEVTPFWAPHMIVTLSLSKLGLPGTRTGIVVADTPVIQRLTAMNTVVGLANGNVGQALAGPLLRSGAMEQLCREVIRPYYQRHSERAADLWDQALGEEVPWMRHEAEGSMFHWLRFPGIPGGSRTLYQRLKEKGVLVIPGDCFFYGLSEPAPEQNECIRVHTAMDAGKVERGIGIIAETVKELSEAG